MSDRGHEAGGCIGVRRKPDRVDVVRIIVDVGRGRLLVEVQEIQFRIAILKRRKKASQAAASVVEDRAGHAQRL